MSGRGLLLGLLLTPAAALAQGFAGLGSGAQGFDLPDPAYRMTFPRDHGPHPEFRVEWWYLTANLKDPQGRDWGAQWTLFRTALDPADPGQQVWMGHAALTTPEAQLTAQRLARGGVGQAGVTLPLDAFIDEWRLSGDPAGTLHASAGGTGFAYDLTLTATGPLVLHGDHGYSVKSAGGQASEYYSQPFLTATGSVRTADGTTPVTGTAWLDREWSSQPLSADQSGWDWFSLSFDSGEKLMGFVLRGNSAFTSATWIAADGTTQALPNGALDAAPTGWQRVAGHRLPLSWQVKLPAHDLDVTVTAIHPYAWMPMLFPYWEGPVTVSGSHNGRGYLELTGYD